MTLQQAAGYQNRKDIPPQQAAGNYQVDDILYMDIDFLADKYEKVTGISPHTVISRNEGMNASIGIPFLKSGLNSQVTKQYKVSNQVMLKAIEKGINNYNLNPSDIIDKYFKPINIWIEGELSIGSWGEEGISEKGINRFYEVKVDEITYSLLPKQEYFAANLEILEIISPALQRYINIPVRLLGKALYGLPDIRTVVITPYIMIARDA